MTHFAVTVYSRFFGQKQIVFIIKFFTNFSDSYHFYPLHYQDISTCPLLTFSEVNIHQDITFSQ